MNEARPRFKMRYIRTVELAPWTELSASCGRHIPLPFAMCAVAANLTLPKASVTIIYRP